MRCAGGAAFPVPRRGMPARATKPTRRHSPRAALPARRRFRPRHVIFRDFPLSSIYDAVNRYSIRSIFRNRGVSPFVRPQKVNSLYFYQRDRLLNNVRLTVYGSTLHSYTVRTESIMNRRRVGLRSCDSLLFSAKIMYILCDYNKCYCSIHADRSRFRVECRIANS